MKRTVATLFCSPFDVFCSGTVRHQDRQFKRSRNRSTNASAVGANSTADGRAATACRARRRSSSSNPGRDAGKDQKQWWPWRRFHTSRKANRNRRWATIKIEADTSVALAERLVKFSTLKITETNFQTLSKEQTREIVSEIEKTIPDEDRSIALDRVLAQVDKSQIIPKNVEGLKSDPPQDIYEPDAGDSGQL